MKKDWIERQLTIEMMVGVFIVMVFLGLAYFTIILSRESLFGNKPEVTVKFDDVMGLREGDGVVVRGMTVGKIKKLDLKEDGVYVIAAMDVGTKLQLRTDYKVTIITTSVLGGRHMQIYEGSANAHDLHDIDVLKGQDAYDLMTDAAEIINALKKGLVDEGIINNFQIASVQLKEIAERLGTGQGTLGKLMSSDEQVYDDIAATAKSLKNISERLEKGEGMLGQLLLDDQLYNSIVHAVDEIRAALDDFRETSPISTFSSVFFGAF